MPQFHEQFCCVSDAAFIERSVNIVDDHCSNGFTAVRLLQQITGERGSRYFRDVLMLADRGDLLLVETGLTHRFFFGLRTFEYFSRKSKNSKGRALRRSERNTLLQGIGLTPGRVLLTDFSAFIFRRGWPPNRVFKSYDDLVDHCCEAWTSSLISLGAS